MGCRRSFAQQEADDRVARQSRSRRSGGVDSGHDFIEPRQIRLLACSATWRKVPILHFPETSLTRQGFGICFPGSQGSLGRRYQLHPKITRSALETGQIALLPSALEFLCPLVDPKLSFCNQPIEQTGQINRVCSISAVMALPRKGQQVGFCPQHCLATQRSPQLDRGLDLRCFPCLRVLTCAKQPQLHPRR